MVGNLNGKTIAREGSLFDEQGRVIWQHFANQSLLGNGHWWRASGQEGGRYL